MCGYEKVPNVALPVGSVAMTVDYNKRTSLLDIVSRDGVKQVTRGGHL